MEATAIAFHGLEIKRELYHAEQCLAYSNFSVNMFHMSHCQSPHGANKHRSVQLAHFQEVLSVITFLSIHRLILNPAGKVYW